MKMNRAVIQVTLEYPAGTDPVNYVKTTGGQLFVCTGKKLVKNELIGDVYPPSVQKKDEFLIVRKLINDALKKAMPKLAIRVYGQRNTNDFTYWAEVGLFAKDRDKYPQPIYLTNMARKYQGFRYSVSKGTLNIMRGYDEWGKKNTGLKAQMSLGDPDISNKIVEFVKKVLGESTGY